MLDKLLGNRYEIMEKVGEGGMALVYKAKDTLLNRYVAVKVLKNEFVDDEDFIRKFRRESQSAASLSHPNIVSIYDVGNEKVDDKDIYYIVMEYIKGKTLKEIIKEKGKLDLDSTLNFSIQIAEALQHAHNNQIVHRDIKPHNIMITEEGMAKVTDFGIARAVSSSTITNTSTVVGSVHYFSPEQAKGRYTDEKSDLYSLGIVMYEMITGKIPFQGDSPISVALKHIQEDPVPPREIDSSVPVGLENIILKCINKNQSERYSSSKELLKDLRRLRYSNEDILLGKVSSVDEATKIIPKINNGDKEIMENNEESEDNNKKKDGGLKVVFLAILLAFVVVSSLALGFFKIKNFFSSDEVIVPSLIGMDEEEAREELDKIGLKLQVVNEVYSDEYDEGLIVEQRTKEGIKVKEGYTIDVTISKGSQLVRVPNLINRNIAEIESLLNELGLEKGVIEYRKSDTVAANTILDQDPDPFSEASPGTKINLVVSEGPDIRMIIMPNLIGLSEQDAKNALIANGLVVGKVTKEPNNEYREGRVFWQEIEPGNQVEENTSVAIYVSTGPEPVTTPPEPKQPVAPPEDPQVPEEPEEPKQQEEPEESNQE